MTMTNSAAGMLRLFRFGCVGLVATMTHAGILLALVEGFQMPAIAATLLGYLVAFGVSYLGHYFVTFRSKRSHKATLPAYVLVAGLGASLHGAIFVVATTIIGWHYWISFLIAIIIVPLIVFAVSARLIFNPAE